MSHQAKKEIGGGKKVKRIYIRHDCMGQDDLFVPVGDLKTIGELRGDALYRLRGLGAALPQGIHELRRKRGEAIPDESLISDVLDDGEVVEAHSGFDEASCNIEFVRVSRPALRDNVALWVPAGNLKTISDIIDAATILLQRTDNRLTISELCLKDGKSLSKRAKWRKVIANGALLEGKAGGGPKMSTSQGQDPTVFKVRHRLDSSVWTPAMVAQGMQGLEIKSPELSTPTLSMDDAISSTAKERDDNAESSSSMKGKPSTPPIGTDFVCPVGMELPPPGGSLSSIGLLQNTNVQPRSIQQSFVRGEGRDVFAKNDDLITKMPGGSYAVFRGGQNEDQSPTKV